MKERSKERTLGQLFKIPPLSAQKCHSAGVGGRQIFVVVFRNPCIVLRTIQ
jgi:hypothetical protein